VPPLADAGVKDFNLEVWVALLGPANLSKAAQARISREVPRIMKPPRRPQALRAGLAGRGHLAGRHAPRERRGRHHDQDHFHPRHQA
jgi:hypothetical protein